MTDKLLIERELLEQVASEFEHDNDRYMLGRELRKVLDAPQQPACGEPVAWMNPYGGVLQKRITGLERETFTIPLYTVKRTSKCVATIQDQLAAMTDCADNYSYMFEQTDLQLSALRLQLAMLATCAANVSIERDTLRQQLAERDATIERLRVKLMTIASAEPRRHNIEWAKAMAATGNNEAHAKWRAAFDQRDNLAGLLAKAQEELDPHRHAVLWGEICVALAEVNK